MGTFPVKSTSYFAYYVIFIDDYSRFIWIYLLKFKSNFFNVYTQFKKFVKIQHSTHIKIFYSDGGVEFTNTCFKEHLCMSVIYHQLSCHYRPTQNGHVE